MSKQRVPLRFRKAHGRFVPGNTVRLLHDGREAFPAMLEAIDQAHKGPVPGGFAEDLFQNIGRIRHRLSFSGNFLT